MRTTHLLMYEQISRSLRKSTDDLGTISARMATGKRIQKPSDDVIGTTMALDYRLSIGASDQYRRNITGVAMSLKFADGVMSAVGDTLGKLRKIAAEGSAGTSSPEMRTGLANHVAELRNYLVGLSNSKFGGRYIFSGFSTDAPAYDNATYAYQGDSGVNRVMIGQGTTVAVNFTGNDVFSYGLGAPETVRLGDGRYVHYTPGAGTSISVEVRDTDDTTVLDSFSFSNVMEMSDLMSSALQGGNDLRMQALLRPFEKAQTQVLSAQAEAGLRLGLVEAQDSALSREGVNLKNALSETEDADLSETIVEFRKLEVALEALREMSSRIMGQSLMDFLK